MDLDYRSVKALASPTRIEILNYVLEEEATTTKISNEIGKSKSTVSSHLNVLTDSGLVDKEEKEGRKRVIYRPTDKAKAIIKGKEKKVRFSIASSAVSGFLGALILGKNYLAGFKDAVYQSATRAPEKSIDSLSEGGDSGDMMIQSAEAANKSAERAGEALTQQGSQIEAVLIVIGFGLIITALMAFAYGYTLNKIRGESD